ncbi:Cyclochlorotine biosynthesis protein R [Lachnellula suecica]|uniref:Cyclochlorotine biosynthesis protein R n=1 Tax=Lachnellula suecica TaxID=602035 RepID=A0A8T9CMA5_9HELO|nr:Cyclochlorotine biosynthesis protein R [Lachnellula suecica]
MAESVPFLNVALNHRVLVDEKDDYSTRNRPPTRWFARHWKDIALLVTTTCTIFLSLSQVHGLFLHGANASKLDCKTSILSPEIDIQRLIPNRWISDYSSADSSGMAEVDKNWNAIRAAHGIVAVDHQWAVENGLPPADDLPSDHSKGVYTLEAYHSLHCLVVIRRTMFQLAEGKSLDVPFGHSTHCIDAVRQSIMCNADDTLLYKRYNVSDGDGQLRKCRNWGLSEIGQQSIQPAIRTVRLQSQVRIEMGVMPGHRSEME